MQLNSGEYSYLDPTVSPFLITSIGGGYIYHKLLAATPQFCKFEERKKVKHFTLTANNYIRVDISCFIRWHYALHRKFSYRAHASKWAPKTGAILPHCTKTLRWLVIFLKPHPLIMCLKKRYGFSKIWVQSLRGMGSECQWAKQRVAKMGFGGFET